MHRKESDSASRDELLEFWREVEYHDNASRDGNGLALVCIIAVCSMLSFVGGFALARIWG